jgi:hypothetical protein
MECDRRRNNSPLSSAVGRGHWPPCERGVAARHRHRREYVRPDHRWLQWRRSPPTAATSIWWGHFRGLGQPSIDTDVEFDGDGRAAGQRLERGPSSPLDRIAGWIPLRRRLVQHRSQEWAARLLIHADRHQIHHAHDPQPMPKAPAQQVGVAHRHQEPRAGEFVSRAD